MSYLKVWNEKIENFTVFDIGKGSFEVDKKNWALYKLKEEEITEKTNYPYWRIFKYIENPDLSYMDSSKESSACLNKSVIIFTEDTFIDFAKKEKNVNWYDGAYTRVKIIKFSTNKNERDEYSVAVPFGVPIFLMDDNGKTVDKY